MALVFVSVGLSASGCEHDFRDVRLASVCGDGVIENAETCDDANIRSGDGCSDICAVEDGWVCDEAGMPCTEIEETSAPVCGDGLVQPGESCDDANTRDRDGCSGACFREPGWICTAAGTPCVPDTLNPVCGDGIITGSEVCDDGNTQNGDGCDASCTLEEAWICSEPGKSCTPEFDDKKSIRILGLGNSFMRDSTIYLPDILMKMGYTDVTVGLLYNGGKSLNWHARNIRNGGKAEVYYLNRNGVSTNTENYEYIRAIESEAWDYFIMQTYPSGVIDLYNRDIDDIVAIVKKHAPAMPKFGWSMTWALQTGKPHEQMPYHGHDSQKMYESTVLSVQNRIRRRSDISLIIPVGTAIQNLRQGILGDNVYRDGYHLSLNNGRFAAALMWAKQLTRRPVGNLIYHPRYPYSDRQIAAIKEAVLHAYQRPFSVTRPSKGVMGTYLAGNEDLQKSFAAAGHSLAEFVEMPVGVTTKAMYDATRRDEDVCQLTALHKVKKGDISCYATMNSAETGSRSSDLDRYAASRLFTRYEIPTGSFIVVKPGFAYRAEGWGADLTQPTPAEKRPAIVDAEITEVNDAWWGDFEYRAFTLSKTGTPELTHEDLDAIESAMSIFVPAPQRTTDEAVIRAGFDPTKYRKLNLSLAYRAYWNSNQESDLPGDGLVMPDKDSTFPSRLCDGDQTADRFAATRIFRKSDIPVGSLVVALKGYAYIPDGWTAMDVSNHGTNRRPGMITAKDADSVVIVDDAWWGSFRYRGFDITEANGTSDGVFMAYQQTMLGEKFAIYVPK